MWEDNDTDSDEDLNFGDHRNTAGTITCTSAKIDSSWNEIIRKQEIGHI